MNGLAEWQKFPSMRAVRGGHVVPYADERMDRMGPSVVEATASLCELVERARQPPTSDKPHRSARRAFYACATR